MAAGRTDGLGAPGPRALLQLAGPSALFVLLTNGYRVVDQYWVDRISVAAQAAVGSTMFVLVVAYASYEVLSAGAGPLVARASGAAEPVARRQVLGAALWGGLVLAAAWALLGGVFAPQLAASLGLEAEARLEATRYLRVLALTGLPLVLTPLVDQAFIATGDAKTPLALHGLALVANLFLTPWFVLELGLGVGGAALASTLARALATGWGILVLARRTGLTLGDLGPGPQLRRVIRIGLPMAGNTALYGGVYWIMVDVAVSPLGPEVNAALGIGWSALEGLSWTLFHGLALAAGSIVGRHLGAGDPNAAAAAARSTLGPTLALGAAATAVFVFGGDTLTGWFASDPEVHRVAMSYAIIVGYSQLFVALETTAEGILAGAGDTRGVFLTSAPFNLLRVPLAWAFALPLGFGAEGLWWVITGTTVAKAGVKLARVAGGAWLRIDPA